ncbi:TIM [Symbiodinium necroappetens]|uniref:TIM protein n=1 Tax=Symbiodinium necroappetens TaxID=1628268 RepID=A0A812KTP7_9DINO|nr:TIM [Symbiodinium necroappetens]
MPPVDYGPLQTQEVSAWDEMESKQLLGSTARKCFQCFCFGLAGWLWALVTFALCIYAAVCPNVSLAYIYGEKATRMVALMLGLAILCSMNATKAAASLLDSEEFGQLLTNYRHAAEDDSHTREDDIRTREVLLTQLIFGLVTGILLFPAFGSEQIYVAGWLGLIGWMAAYSQGYKRVLWLVQRLSKCLVQQFMAEMHAGPAEWKGTGKFWQDMTTKHYDMDLKLQSAWTLASWAFAPEVASLGIFTMIALVACLSAAIKSKNGALALASLLGVVPPLFRLGKDLQRIASITDMCLSTTATSNNKKSIMSLAIAQSGHSPFSPSEIQKAGYGRVDDERADHAVFLRYLMINKCGVAMFGVLIDSRFILGVLANVATAFFALLSYLLATLDIQADDIMQAQQSFTRELPFQST